MSKKQTRIFLGLAILMMVLLFISSAMTYQQQTLIPKLRQVKITWLSRFLQQLHFQYAGQTHSVAIDGQVALLEFLIRKLAHFGSYFLLGGFAFLGLTPHIPQLGFRLGLVWLATVGYAATDEFHQSLTGQRSPMIEDVMLDAFGALVGILVALMVYGLIRHHQRQRVRLHFAADLR